MWCVSYPSTAKGDEKSRKTEGQVKGLLRRKTRSDGILNVNSIARQVPKEIAMNRPFLITSEAQATEWRC
jgi:hypothetical protein